MNGSIALETEFHRKFKKNRLIGEWFTYDATIKAFIDTNRALDTRPNLEALQKNVG